MRQFIEYVDSMGYTPYVLVESESVTAFYVHNSDGTMNFHQKGNDVPTIHREYSDYSEMIIDNPRVFNA